MQQQQPPAHSVHLPGPNNYQAGGPPAPHGTCNPYYGFHHQQPQQPRPPAVGQWSTGLCGAHGEYLNCLVTHFCPWITFGQIAEIVDEGTTSCCAGSLLFLGVHCCFGCCFTPMVTYVYRARIRQKFNIPPGKCCGDFCLHFWCECFALRQEWRELKRRGLDPSLGWEAIIRRSQQVMQAPVWPPQMISEHFARGIISTIRQVVRAINIVIGIKTRGPQMEKVKVWCGLPNVHGAIDRTHTFITRPPGAFTTDYYFFKRGGLWYGGTNSH